MISKISIRGQLECIIPSCENGQRRTRSGLRNVRVVGGETFKDEFETIVRDTNFGQRRFTSGNKGERREREGKNEGEKEKRKEGDMREHVRR